MSSQELVKPNYDENKVFCTSSKVASKQESHSNFPQIGSEMNNILSPTLANRGPQNIRPFPQKKISTRSIGYDNNL